MPHVLRIVHLSDTHNMHRHLTLDQLGTGDILAVTGDFTNEGTPDEVKDFNDWLGEIRASFDTIVVILGNHEWQHALKCVRDEGRAPQTLLDPLMWRNALANATHVLLHESANIKGVTVFGSSWDPWHEGNMLETEAPKDSAKLAVMQCVERSANAACVPHHFDQIPAGVDLLLTHSPASGIFDMLYNGSQWGSSRALRDRIELVKPRVHLFGHMHEQRGVFVKQADGRYTGGVEYTKQPGGPVCQTWSPPPASYPCQLIVNNAMLNHKRFERAQTSHLAGSPRVILAMRAPDGAWDFHLPRQMTFTVNHATNRTAFVREAPTEDPCWLMNGDSVVDAQKKSVHLLDMHGDFCKVRLVSSGDEGWVKTIHMAPSPMQACALNKQGGPILLRVNAGDDAHWTGVDAQGCTVFVVRTEGDHALVVVPSKGNAEGWIPVRHIDIRHRLHRAGHATLFLRKKPSHAHVWVSADDNSPIDVQDATVSIHDIHGRYVKVRSSNGDEGWVEGEYITPTPRKVFLNDHSARLLPLRVGPSNTSELRTDDVQACYAVVLWQVHEYSLVAPLGKGVDAGWVRTAHAVSTIYGRHTSNSTMWLRTAPHEAHDWVMRDGVPVDGHDSDLLPLQTRGLFVQVRTEAGVEGWVKVQHLHPRPRTVLITAPGVNLKATPDMASRSTGVQVGRGTEAMAIGVVGSYTRVVVPSHRGAEGWVKTTLLASLLHAAHSTEDCLPLIMGADPNAPTLEMGGNAHNRNVRPLELRGDFCRVRTGDGAEGWLESKRLSPQPVLGHACRGKVMLQTVPAPLLHFTSVDANGLPVIALWVEGGYSFVVVPQKGHAEGWLRSSLLRAPSS
jgi:Icc-related predicted phosphoesterase